MPIAVQSCRGARRGGREISPRPIFGASHVTSRCCKVFHRIGGGCHRRKIPKRAILLETSVSEFNGGERVGTGCSTDARHASY